MKDINSIARSGKLFDGRYELVDPLSSDGGTADVWLAVDRNTIDEKYDSDDDVLTTDEDSGIKVAIKIYRPKNALDLGEKRFREEFKIVFNCHHTNLVQPINFSIYEDIPYLVLPYCEKGSSETLLGRITDKDELWRYIADVSAGLAYLHAYKPTIVHHDIKPANILIDDNDNYAITDFGISSHRGLNRDGYDESNSGTIAYMAPERFREDYDSTPESDIWSFGATLYELVTGTVPFGEEGGLTQLESSGASVPPLPRSVPKDIRRLIRDCLSLDSSRRPSAEYIHRAAEAKRYPLKNRSKLYVAGALILLVAAASALFFMPASNKEIAEAPAAPVAAAVSTDEERYARAMELMASTDADDLRKGLGIMDSLGRNGYIPALYEQAYTYGWYSDSASVARKSLLGIGTYPVGTSTAYLPKSQPVNTRAIGLLYRIEELDSPDYPEINANALYRLACYYVNDNELFKCDANRARLLLVKARKWAEECGDTELLNKINVGFEKLKNSND